MKRLMILLMLANLSLAAGCVVLTYDSGEMGTPIVATQITQPGYVPTPELADTSTLWATPQDEARELFTPTMAAATDVVSTPAGASVTVDVDLNVRTGPGTNYEPIGWLAAGTRVAVIGRVADGTWWQIPYPDAPDGVAWISAGYGRARDTQGVPVVEAPSTPTPSAPTATPTPTAPPPPPPPAYQYTPTGWYGDTNYGLTRFMGDIKDTAGNPVDGVFVRAVCGTYATISYPSGPVGWGPLGESSDWPPGFYDITVDSKPVPCMWTLQVVATDDRQTVKAELSEAVPVEVTHEQSVIQADWRKNW
jgi:uncharacterized protein YraI